MKIKEKIQTYREYIRNYKFHSLFLKNLSLLLILILVPFTAASVIGYYAIKNMQQNNMNAYSQRLATEFYGDWKRILKEAEMELRYIGFSSNVELFFYDTEQLKQLNYSLRTVMEMIRMPVLAKNYVNSVYAYSEGSGKVISPNGVSNYDTFTERACIDACRTSGDSLVVTETRDTEEPQLSMGMEIRYGPNHGGWLVMNLNLDEIAEEIEIPEHVRLFLLSGEEILFDSQGQLTGHALETLPELSQRRINDTVLVRSNSISSLLSQDHHLEVVTFLDTETAHTQMSAVGIFILVFLLFMFLLTLALTALISLRIFQPIGEILYYIETYQGTLVGEEQVLQDKNELEYILHSIQRTATVKKDVDKELAERVRLLKKAQAVALQAQINPHFINNTLDTINWTAISLLGGRNEISEMIGALSKMMRSALGDTDTIIPISAEVEHCRNYLLLQKKRYEDQFDVFWNLPEEIYDYKTVRLILQPVVENAIYHGLKPLSNKGLLTVKGSVLDQFVELEVTDNGLGMSPQELQKLQDSLNSEVIRENRHIGLSNVNQRLKLYFGEESGVFIRSQEGMGTSVTVRFPKISK